MKIATVNTSDKVLIMDAREGYSRRTNIGSNWLDVRIGMYFTLVPLANDDAACAASSIVIAGFRDWATFGLKDSSANAPGQAGSQFMGSCMSSATIAIGANTGSTQTVNTSDGANRMSTLNGATVLTNNNGGAWNIPIFSTGNSNGFLGMRFRVVNAGLSTQTITMDMQIDAGPATSVTADTIRTKMLSQGVSNTGSHTWNASGAALPLPDYLYARLPFTNNRLRITSLAYMKLA